MRRLLVTGRHGFVGSVLASRLAERHAGTWTLAEISPDLDLCDLAATRALVDVTRPDAVVHLAAQSAVYDALRDPERTLQVNVLGTLHLLQALSSARFRGRMLYVGSGDVYGEVAADALPIDEKCLPRPRNPYAVSKLAAEALCYQWHVTEGLDIVLARPFNHIGPGQGDRFVVSSFARQVAEVRRGRRAPRVQVGNLDTTRDFTDVRDVVDAYLALIERGEPGEVYNVCSGKECSVRAVLESLVAMSGVEIAVEQDTSRMRASETMRMRGSPAKLIERTGWQPLTPLDVSLRDTLTYWEQKIDE